ncbi:hypothetical protein ES703_19335 [subsurface metagenome]
MVNTIRINIAADYPSDVEIDLSPYLEGPIAHITHMDLIDTHLTATAYTVDAQGRMSPVPAGTTVVTAHVRLTDWEAFTFGGLLPSEHDLQIKLLYLKDAPGVYPGSPTT